MERLTKRIFVPTKERDVVVFTQGEYIDTIPAEMTHEDIRKVLRKLAEYEELEEQGLLLRLQCKVGDILYHQRECFNIVIPVRLNEIVMSFVGLDTYSFQYNCCSFDECGDVYEEYEFGLNDFNKTVFLTKTEAEQKLKEMESD